MNKKCFKVWLLTGFVFVAVIVVVLIKIFHNERVPFESLNGTSVKLPYSEKIYEKTGEDYYTAERYLSLAEIMQKNTPEFENKAVAEYTLINRMSFAGTRYYNVKISADGTGVMTYLYYHHKESQINDGFIVTDSSVVLDKEKSEAVAELFEENNFWKIPTEHPEEEEGFDGNTVFVEAAYGDKHNFIHMWMPEDKYEIAKIQDSLNKFAEEWGIDFKIDEDKIKELEELREYE